MAWTIGTPVIVHDLGRARGVVVAVGRDGRYQVRVEALTMWCRESNLSAAPDDRRPGRKPAARHEPPARPEPAARAGRVDLHGLTVQDATSRLLAAVDDALRRGADRVEIVHGRGTGRIKHAVHRQLASLDVVRRFALDERNPGVTWAFL
jgi:DNA mismatch repair protein MutS2